jgi:hypothetical protein
MNTTIRFSDFIRADIEAIHSILLQATDEAREASHCIARDERNLAIAALILLEPLLGQLIFHYKAVFAMHQGGQREGQ